MININLIAERRARKIREITILRMSTLGVLLLFVAMGLLNLVTYVEKGIAVKNIKTVNGQLHEVENRKVKLDRIKEKISSRAPVVDLLKQVQMSEAAWMIILADFPRVMPHDVAISGISPTVSKDGVLLNIAGTASDEETVGEFMVAVREKTRWADTATPGTITALGDAGAGVRFSLTIPVRGLFGGEIK